MDNTTVSTDFSTGNPPDMPPMSPPPEQIFSSDSAISADIPKADEAFVVSPSSASNVNPFIPQVTPDTGSQYQSPSVGSVPQSGGGTFFTRILSIVILLVIVVGVIFGIRYALSMVGSGSSSLGGVKSGTLVYWGLWENDATVRSVLAGFEATHPNIKVQYVKQNPKQYRERLQAFIAKGEGPDVFRFHNTWIPMLRNELSAAPSTVISASEFSTSFYPVANADLVGGQYVYGMPMEIDGLGLYYNEDLFAAAGVSPPTTWEDVLNIVPKITVRNENTIITSAIALGTAGNVEHFSDILATMMMQNGAKLSNPTGQQAEEALTFYKKFSTPSDPVYTWNDSMDNSIYAFASGKVAMILAPSWRVFDVKQISPALRFKVVPIPQLPGNTVTWASYWVEGVSAKSKNSAAAWELVKYMASREATTKMYTEASKTRLFGEPYARVDMASLISDDPYVGAYVKQASTAKSFPLASRTFDNGLNTNLIKYMEDAINSMTQGSAPAAALETAASGFAQVLGNFGLSTGAVPKTTP